MLLAVPWPTVEAALSGLPKWQGQLLVDPTNGFNDGTPAGGLADFDGGSSSEHVASLAPGARVVKAMNAVFMNKSATGPTEGGFRRAVFVSGHDDDARRVVADLFESFGFAPVDPGPLKVGERIQGVGGPIEGHDFFLPWPEQRAYLRSTATRRDARYERPIGKARKAHRPLSLRRSARCSARGG